MYGFGNGWGMMGDGYGSMGGFSMVFWLLALVLLAGAVVWFMRSSPSIRMGRQAAAGPTSGLDLLEQRYARGDSIAKNICRRKTICKPDAEKAVGRL